MDFDSHTERFRSDPERLARVFALALEDGPAYSPAELAPILRHQLATSIEFDLSSLDPGSQRLLRAAAACGDGSGIHTFRDLFRHPHPPVHLLQLTKEFAKTHLHHPDSPLPPEIATVLYYTSIVAALIRLNRHLTTLPREDLLRGLQHLLIQPWLDPELRKLLQLGLRRVQAGSPD